MAIRLRRKLPQDQRDRRGASDALVQIGMTECRVCGAGNRSSRRTCFNCGALLSADDMQPKHQAAIVDCRVCGAGNRSSRRTCFNCGASLSADDMQPKHQAAIVDCRVCGAGNRFSRQACFKCGSLLHVAGAKPAESVPVVRGGTPTRHHGELAGAF